MSSPASCPRDITELRHRLRPARGRQRPRVTSRRPSGEPPHEQSHLHLRPTRLKPPSTRASGPRRPRPHDGVWSEDDEVVCVHPGSIRLIGFLVAIRESWRQLFASGARITVSATHPVRWSNLMTAVHTVHQHVHVEGDDRLHPPIIATNVFARGAARLEDGDASRLTGPRHGQPAQQRQPAHHPLTPSHHPLHRTLAGFPADTPRPSGPFCARGRCPIPGANAGTHRTATSSTWTGCPIGRAPRSSSSSTASKAPASSPYARSLMRMLAALGLERCGSTLSWLLRRAQPAAPSLPFRRRGRDRLDTGAPRHPAPAASTLRSRRVPGRQRPAPVAGHP
jgi:hypothetical protein